MTRGGWQLRNGEAGLSDRTGASVGSGAGGGGGGGGGGVRLLPPAMRRVTDCIRVALQSVDMAEVILRFLRNLDGLELDVPPKFLPRSVALRFQV